MRRESGPPGALWAGGGSGATCRASLGGARHHPAAKEGTLGPLRRVREDAAGTPRVRVPGSGGRTHPFLPRGARAQTPPTPRPAFPTAIPCPLPRPRARGSGRARARAPRCARAPAGRRPRAASGARQGPAGGGSRGAGGRVPALGPRPRPAACPVARLEEAGQVRTRPRPPAPPETPGRVGSATQWRVALTAPDPRITW